jgi:hypothetical protein
LLFLAALLPSNPGLRPPLPTVLESFNDVAHQRASLGAR